MAIKPQKMRDAWYQRERDNLIPIAERHANKQCGISPKGSRDEWSEKWTKCFACKMDELARENGLIC